MTSDQEDALADFIRDGGVARDWLDVVEGVDRDDLEETLERWCDEGIYDYGVSVDLGWMVTP
jgi:hypothetical protein